MEHQLLFTVDFHFLRLADAVYGPISRIREEGRLDGEGFVVAHVDPEGEITDLPAGPAAGCRQDIGEEEFLVHGHRHVVFIGVADDVHTRLEAGVEMIDVVEGIGHLAVLRNGLLALFPRQALELPVRVIGRFDPLVRVLVVIAVRDMGDPVRQLTPVDKDFEMAHVGLLREVLHALVRIGRGRFEAYQKVFRPVRRIEKLVVNVHVEMVPDAVHGEDFFLHGNLRLGDGDELVPLRIEYAVVGKGFGSKEDGQQDDIFTFHKREGLNWHLHPIIRAAAGRP